MIAASMGPFETLVKNHSGIYFFYVLMLNVLHVFKCSCTVLVMSVAGL